MIKRTYLISLKKKKPYLIQLFTYSTSSTFTSILIQNSDWTHRHDPNQLSLAQRTYKAGTIHEPEATSRCKQNGTCVYRSSL